MKKMWLIVLFGALLVVVGCKEEAEIAKPQAAEALPGNLIATSQPTGAVDVSAAKKTAKDGDSVVIKGRIGGQKEPLAANRAIMTVAEMSLPMCDEIPGDKCPTPWDACCEPTATITAQTVSVQVLDADQHPIKTGLNGISGIAPHKNVIVAGIARMTPGSDAMMIDAKQIYVVP
jgi:hypothetical protein